VYMYI